MVSETARFKAVYSGTAPIIYILYPFSYATRQVFRQQARLAVFMKLFHPFLSEWLRIPIAFDLLHRGAQGDVKSSSFRIFHLGDEVPEELNFDRERFFPLRCCPLSL